MKKIIFAANIVCCIMDLYNGWYSLFLLNLAGAAIMIIDLPGEE